MQMYVVSDWVCSMTMLGFQWDYYSCASQDVGFTRMQRQYADCHRGLERSILDAIRAEEAMKGDMEDARRVIYFNRHVCMYKNKLSPTAIAMNPKQQ